MRKFNDFICECFCIITDSINVAIGFSFGMLIKVRNKLPKKRGSHDKS